MNRSIAGYELEHRLGDGAGGTVWRARQRSSLGRPVALKRIHVGADDAARARLRHEARLLAELDHPRIVKVFEVVDDGDELAIAMQLAAGGSLADRLSRRGRLTPASVARIGADLADALASAHRRGIVHGDVSPSNVLFTSDGEVLLSDFGTAMRTAIHHDGVGVTIEGTPGYVAPEVLAGATPDERADVYSLGVVCAELLEGGDAPDWLRAVVATAADPEPANRFGSAAAFAAALRAEGRAGTSPPVEISSAPAPDPDAAALRIARTREFGPRPRRPAPAAGGRSRRVGVIVASVVVASAALAFVSIAVLGHAVTATRHRPDPAAASAHRGPGAEGRTVSPSCPAPQPPVTGAPAGDVLLGDIDGDGCADAVVRQGNVLVRRAGDGVERFAVGAEGDTPVLGDWDCDGVVTPGAFRPSTGQAFLFDGWPAAGDLAAVRTIAATAPPVSRCPSP